MQTLARLSLPLAALLIGLLPLRGFNVRDAAAQDAQSGPVAVVAFSGVDAIVGDVTKLLSKTGAAADAAAVLGLTKMMTGGIDGTRPWGVTVNAGAGGFQTLAFVPATDVAALLASPALASQLGEPKPLADGVQQFDLPSGQSVFIKGEGGWAYISDSADTLTAVPADPLPLLGGLEKQYDIAARVHVQRIPPAMRQMLLSGAAGLAGGGLPGGPGADGLGPGIEPGGLGEAPGADPFGGAPAGGAAGGEIDMLAAVLGQVDQLTVGLSIDGDTPKAIIDVTVSGAAGSDLARRIAALSGAKSDHSGLLLPDAAVALHLAVPLLAEDAEALAMGVEAAASQAPAPTAEEKELADLGKQLVTATIRSAKLDGGFAVVNKPGASAFVYGGKAADADALRQVMIDLVHEAQKGGGLTKDKFERIDHKGYRFVIVRGIKTPPGDDLLRKMCGDEIEVTLALNGGDHYLAMGQQTAELLKSVIDASQAGAQNPAVPLTLSIGTRATLAASRDWSKPGSVDPAMVEKLSGIAGPDRVLLTLTPSGSSATLRLEVQEVPLLGIVSMVQDQIKAVAGGFGGPPGAGPAGPPGGASPF